MAKPILVGIDPGRDDPSPPALAWRPLAGDRRADRRDRHLPVGTSRRSRLLHAARRGADGGPRGARPRLAQALTGFDVYDKGGLQHVASRALHVVAEDLDAGLIVVGSTQRGPLGRIVPGGHTEQTIHGAPCPVAVAPHGYALPEGPMTRIGVAFHDTPEGHEALTGAAALARRCEPRCTCTPSSSRSRGAATSPRRPGRRRPPSAVRPPRRRCKRP